MKFLGNWTNAEDVINSFDIRESELQNAVIHVAWYGYGSYDGSGFVLFERDGQLFEANAGHCSCYGLEGQWDPEETTVEALELRYAAGGFGYYDDDRDAAAAVLEFCRTRRET